MTPLESKPRGPRSVRPEGPFRWLEPGDLTEQIVLWGSVGTELARIRAQMKHIDDFVECDIDPPTRLLFIGPSGTGKSLAAWTIGAALGVTAGSIGGVLGAKKLFDKVMPMSPEYQDWLTQSPNAVH